jgi:hypothetical protein
MELRPTLIAISNDAHATSSSSRWDRPSTRPRSHENCHVGEIGALRKALGKPRIG